MLGTEGLWLQASERVLKSCEACGFLGNLEGHWLWQLCKSPASGTVQILLTLVDVNDVPPNVFQPV